MLVDFLLPLGYRRLADLGFVTWCRISRFLSIFINFLHINSLGWHNLKDEYNSDAWTTYPLKRGTSWKVLSPILPPHPFPRLMNFPPSRTPLHLPLPTRTRPSTSQRSGTEKLWEFGVEWLKDWRKKSERSSIVKILHYKLYVTKMGPYCSGYLQDHERYRGTYYLAEIR